MNLQKIESEKLLEPLTVNVFNLKKKKGGCRVKLRDRLDGGGKDLLYSTLLPLPPPQSKQTINVLNLNKNER